MAVLGGVEDPLALGAEHLLTRVKDPLALGAELWP